MKELEVEVRVRNNRLKQRRRALGLSQKELAAAAGMPPTSYNCLENMRWSPFCKNGKYREGAWKLSIFFGVPLEELFPRVVERFPESRAIRKVDAENLAPLLGWDVEEPPRLPDEIAETRELSGKALELVDELPERERIVIRRQFGLGCQAQTLEEIADYIGVSRERVRQLKNRGLGRLYRGMYEMDQTAVPTPEEVENIVCETCGHLKPSSNRFCLLREMPMPPEHHCGRWSRRYLLSR